MQFPILVPPSDLVRLCAGGIVPAEPRAIGLGISQENRRVFLEIAERARVEQVNSYTVLCLGLKSYLVSREVSNGG